MSDSDNPFVIYPDPRLLEPAMARPVDAALRSIGARLLQAGREVQAYGLAAVHIGHVAPVVLVSDADPSHRDYRLLYNPRILQTSGDDVIGKEGSVSLPGIEIDVSRPNAVNVGYDDEQGQPATLDLTGFAARVAQHEIDQVNGIFFLSRVSRLKREAAIKRFSKLGRRMG